MSTPHEHPFVTHQPPGLPPSQAPMATSNLSIQAQSEETKYQTKYRELRYKVKAIETENDKLQVKVLNVKKNIQRLRLERAILYERLMSISGANNGPPIPAQGPISAGAPGIPPPPMSALPASYYQPPHASQSQPSFPNPTLPKVPPTGSHHHHHHGHHHHHHHHSQSAQPTSSGTGAPGMEYPHATSSSSLGPGGDRYYSNEPRGPSPGSNSHLHNGQSSMRREHRGGGGGELTPGRVPPGGPPHGGVSIGALEHGMPPPPSTTGHARYSGHRESYGHGHHGHYANNSVGRPENGEEGHWESRRRSGSRSDRDWDREHERDRDRMPAENHVEDHAGA